MKKIGIDTNIFVELFESSESLDKIREEGEEMYIHKKCLWEMVKYIKKLNLQDSNTEGIVARFMERNQIHFIDPEISQEEIKNFEEQCKKKGINCHYPDSMFVLAFQREGIKKMYSKDSDCRNAAQSIGIEIPWFNLNEDKPRKLLKKRN